jgi:arylsulfatase A-like enzyme
MIAFSSYERRIVRFLLAAGLPGRSSCYILVADRQGAFLKPSRKSRICSILLALGSVVLAWSCRESGELPRPNLILVSIDTLRADHLTAYGYQRPTSPVISRLADEGILFEQAFSQSPKTATSHMSLLTGVYPPAHRVANWGERRVRRLSDDVPTLATMLARSGYRTEAHTDGGNVSARLGFDQGFERYLERRGARTVFEGARKALERFAQKNGPGTRDPFFLFVHTFEVHDPYLSPAQYAAEFVDPSYSGDIVGSRDELDRLVGGGDYWARHKAYWDRVDRADPADLQHLQDLYDAGILYSDAQLGALMDHLRSLDLDAQTIVVVLSDHGEEFLEHGGFLHNSLFQEILHVPLIFRFPASLSLPSGLRSQTIVELVDVVPTLLEAMGLPAPEHLQGRSLMPLIVGGEVPTRPVFSQWLAGGRIVALRDGDWKYIRVKRQEQLFDLSEDPGESADRLFARPEILARLQAKVDEIIGESYAFAEAQAPARPPSLEKETRKQLEALGYLDGDS